MKKRAAIFLCLALTIGAFAQTQRGYVETIGQLGSDGKVTGVKRVGGVSIKLANNKGTESNADGRFSIEVGKTNFQIKQVSKKGFTVRSPYDMTKSYSYSSNDFVIVIEDREESYRIKEQEIQKRTVELGKKLSEERKLNFKLYEEGKRTEQEYENVKKELNDRKEHEEKTIKSIAEWLSTTDFSALDTLNLRISRLISEGKNREALDLIHSQGDISEQINKVNQDKDALGKHKEETAKRIETEHKAEEAIQRQILDLTTRCYNAYQAHLEQYQLDSALFYLTKRLELDTNNVEWLSDIAKFYSRFKRDHNKALEYYNKALTIQKYLFGETHLNLATTYRNIGYVYLEKNDFNNALDYFDKALSLREIALDENLSDLAKIYSNRGYIYFEKKDYDKSLEYYNKASKIEEQILGKKHFNLATICRRKSAYTDPDRDKNYFNLATTYRWIGVIYDKQGIYDKALDFYNKSIKSYKHAMNYYGNELDSIYRICLFSTTGRRGDFELVTTYRLAGVVYGKKNKYVKGLKLLNEARKILEQTLSSNDPYAQMSGTVQSLGTVYRIMGEFFDKKSDINNALKYYNKALRIRKLTYGEESALTKSTQARIDEIKRKLGKE